MLVMTYRDSNQSVADNWSKNDLSFTDREFYCKGNDAVQTTTVQANNCTGKFEKYCASIKHAQAQYIWGLDFDLWWGKNEKVISIYERSMKEGVRCREG